MRYNVVGLLLTLSLCWGRADAIEMHVVPVPIQSNRLLGMSSDDDGNIWCGSFLRAIHRYDPRTTQIETIPLPNSRTATACLCVGSKVYCLGQKYPKLVIYDRGNGTFREVDYPVANPEVWYGTELIDGRYLYLFERTTPAIIKWDTQTETGRAIPYPLDPPLLSGGRYVEADRALWCSVTDTQNFQYRQLGVVRFDLETEKFSDYLPWPKDDEALEPYSDPSSVTFIPATLQGKIIPLDFQARAWHRPLKVPNHGTRFGFIGGPTVHAGRWYFSISTYNGTPLGCDGKPYHFCNGLLEFDPVSRQFAFPLLDVADGYYQVSYSYSSGKEFYATGTNIRQPDGTLDTKIAGSIVVWTTRKPERNALPTSSTDSPRR